VRRKTAVSIAGLFLFIKTTMPRATSLARYQGDRFKAIAIKGK
jgi:hypothetical protein